MSPKRIPTKPDRLERGGVYICNLPIQLVTEITDGKVHNRDGSEQYGSPPCVVISTGGFNDSQVRGVIVVPIKNVDKADMPKFKVVPSTWVRIITRGEPWYVLVEQVRYIDQSRCKARIGELIECDMKQIENKLKQLLFQ